MSLDAQLRKILEPFGLQLAKEGKMLTCTVCFADASYLCRGLCGPCFLFGDRAKASDLRTPKNPHSRQEMS